MKTIAIISSHTSLSDAVAAAGIDLSYNEPLARADLRRFDTGGRDAAVTEAYVVADGDAKKVLYVFNCDLPLLNEYRPFHGCLHDGKFSFARIANNEITITDGITSDRRAIKSALAASHPLRLLACKF